MTLAALVCVPFMGIGGLVASASAAAPTCPTRPVHVVVSVNQWSDIVRQLAGVCGDVTTIFNSTSADPHEYEPTPADIAEFTGAGLVVINGLGYDSWAEKAVATLDQQPQVVNGGTVVGLRSGDNPHIWYGPGYVYQMAKAITAALRRVAPKDTTYFNQRHSRWRASMRPYDAEIAKIKASAPRTRYAATEGIFDDMAAALGFENVTPRGYQKAATNESEPAPGDVQTFEQSLQDHEIAVLIFNTQTEGAVPDQIRGTAMSSSVPVVDVTESMPPKVDSFVRWQLRQLQDLAAAVGA